MRRLHWFAELPSTNDHALELAVDEDTELPCLVWAERQTAGRGRGTHAWWSAPGSLTFSLLADSASLGIASSDWPQVSVLTGLAVAGMLTQFVAPHRVGLKWPNDVWLDGRKVCGILTETPPRRPDRLVVGVGINVRNSFRSAPLELQQIATALCDVEAEPPSTTEILLAWCETWTRLLNDWKRRELRLSDSWSRYCVLTDRRVRVVTGETRTDGLCAGLAADGALLLDTASGRERLLGGTVRLL